MSDPRLLKEFQVGKFGMPNVFGFLKKKPRKTTGGGKWPAKAEPVERENYWPEKTNLQANIAEMERKAAERKAAEQRAREQQGANPAMPEMRGETQIPMNLMKQRYKNIMKPL